MSQMLEYVFQCVLKRLVYYLHLYGLAPEARLLLIE